jgi:anti-sigma-K factor RskA
MADKFTALAEPFALGMLEENEARQFEQHLASGCRECQQAVDEAERVARLLPYAVPQNEPPADLKRRLLEAVAAEAKIIKMRPASENSNAAQAGPATIRSMPQRTFFQRVRGTLAWAAVFLLFAIGYSYFLQRGMIKQQQQIALQEQQLAEKSAEIKLLNFEMERQKLLLNRSRKALPRACCW